MAPERIAMRAMTLLRRGAEGSAVISTVRARWAPAATSRKRKTPARMRADTSWAPTK